MNEEAPVPAFDFEVETLIVGAGAAGLTAALAAHQLSVLLAAGNPADAQGAPEWRPVGPRS